MQRPRLCSQCDNWLSSLTRPLGYNRVYLTLYKVADTPFHVQE